jgi:hypothetical protein
MQIMIRAGRAWRVSQNQKIKRFNRSETVSYQGLGDKITSMGKTNQKSDEGKNKEASNERFRGPEKSPALN